MFIVKDSNSTKKGSSYEGKEIAIVAVGYHSRNTFPSHICLPSRNKKTKKKTNALF